MTYYVIGCGTAASWVLSLDGYKSAAAARQSVNWQKQGPSGPNYEWHITTYDREEKVFVTADGLLLYPQAGPYTPAVFKQWADALGYEHEELPA